MKLSLMTVCGLALAASAQASVFITEVVDGDLSGGNPKFVELCNPTNAPVTFGANDFVRVYFNGSGSATTAVSLDGITLAANDALVIASSANDGANQFRNAYGFDADLYTTQFFGNGDDVYTLEGVSGLIDTYGVVGVDGTGFNWEYTDSFAYRNANITGPNSTFTSGEWTFGGVAALDGPDDATRIALLRRLTTPGVHVPTPGAAALAGLAGLVAARRRRA